MPVQLPTERPTVTSRPFFGASNRRNSNRYGLYFVFSQSPTEKLLTVTCCRYPACFSAGNDRRNVSGVSRLPLANKLAERQPLGPVFRVQSAYYRRNVSGYSRHNYDCSKQTDGTSQLRNFRYLPMQQATDGPSAVSVPSFVCSQANGTLIVTIYWYQGTPLVQPRSH